MDEHIKMLEEMKTNCIKGMMKGDIYTDVNAERKALAIDNIINKCKILERQIDIKDEYLRTIYAIGFDYDGFDDSENLKCLIDSLVDFAKRAIKNDDKYAMYEGCGSDNSTKYYNILHEEVPAPKED